MDSKKKKGVGGRGLTESQLLEGGCWERGDDFFQGACKFYVKNKLTTINNDKNSINRETYIQIYIINI